MSTEKIRTIRLGATGTYLVSGTDGALSILKSVENAYRGDITVNLPLWGNSDDIL